jgi:hypothetical protein
MMAQKMHPCADEVASCVMRAIVPLRPDGCYSVDAADAHRSREYVYDYGRGALVGDIADDWAVTLR